MQALSTLTARHYHCVVIIHNHLSRYRPSSSLDTLILSAHVRSIRSPHLCDILLLGFDENTKILEVPDALSSESLGQKFMNFFGQYYYCVVPLASSGFRSTRHHYISRANAIAPPVWVGRCLQHGSLRSEFSWIRGITNEIWESNINQSFLSDHQHSPQNDIQIPGNKNHLVTRCACRHSCGLESCAETTTLLLRRQPECLLSSQTKPNPNLPLALNWRKTSTLLVRPFAHEEGLWKGTNWSTKQFHASNSGAHKGFYKYQFKRLSSPLTRLDLST